jgi:hypothetical protein
MTRKQSFTAYEITQAFRVLRELEASQNGVDYANGDNYTIREIELLLMDILQPVKSSPEKLVQKVSKLSDASLDDFNDALFG